MSGQIFISYRRDDTSYPAGRLYDRLLAHFLQNQIFIDVDLDPGIDFVEAIEKSVGSCDVLIAVIGKRWLLSSDEERKRRLDNTEDFVRVEIATALKRNIRVIPVLVDGSSIPRSSDLPDDLKLLARRNALEVSHNRFNADFGRLVTAIEKVLKKADDERKRCEETPSTKAEAEAAVTRGIAF
jgi:TIR domain